MLSGMRSQSCWVLLLGLLCFLSLAGCGATAGPVPAETRPVTTNLAGNWLLAGTLPAPPFQNAVTGTQLSAAFNTVGDQIVGLGVFLAPCPAITGTGLLGTGDEGGGFEASGTVAADGSFLVQSPATTTSGLSIPSVSISGTVPSAPGGSWNGSYSISMSGTPGCTVQESASLTAQAIQSFSGTYAATGTYSDGTTQSPVTVTMVLLQGSSTAAANGVAANTASILSGTITVAGVPCFRAVLPLNLPRRSRTVWVGLYSVAWLSRRSEWMMDRKLI